MYNDYIILFDSSGQPYIAHAWGSRFSSAASRFKSGVKSAGAGMGRGYRTAHKYLLKVGEGAKARYAYTKEEVDALMGRGRQAASDAAKKVGQKGREALSTAGSKIRDYSSRTASTLSRHGTETLKTVKDYANRAANKAKDVAGVDERERRDKAWDNLGSRIDTSSEKSRDAWKDFEKARSDYMKTPLGKIEYTKERAKEILTGQDGTIKDIAQDLGRKAGTKIKETANNTKDRASEVVSKVKDQVSESADKFARDIVPGYAERQHWQEDEKKAAEAKEKYDSLNAEYAKAVNAAVAASKNRDSSAAASDSYDKAVATIRKLTDDDRLLKAQKEVWAANEATWDSGRAYAKTPLGKVEDFMKDPLFNTGLAIKGVVWEAQDKIRDARQKMADRRQEKASAKAEAAMKKDPKVMKARETLSTYESEYNAAENRFMDYVTSDKAEKGSDEWKRLERAYDLAREDLEYAQTELERYEKPYRK